MSPKRLRYSSFTAQAATSSVSDALRVARETIGLSQNAAAEQLGVSQADLSRYENNAVTPSVEVLLNAAIVYERPPASFLPTPEQLKAARDTIDTIEKEG